MTMTLTPTSPLAADLRSEAESRVRERGLVVWLDKEGHYTDFVDTLREEWESGSFFAPVITFRGSFLETMLDLEPYAQGLDPEPLLLHVPGHNDTTIRETPLLEAYKAGTRYERALETLIRKVAAGRVDPEETERFLQSETVSLKEAERWLESFQSVKGGFGGYLHHLQPQYAVQELMTGGSKLEKLADQHGLGQLHDYLSRHTGFSTEFKDRASDSREEKDYRSLRDAFVSWLLCVEYVHDLKRSPHIPLLTPLAELSPPLRKTCLQLTEVVRERFPRSYRELALQAESLVEEDLERGEADELGKIDTFSKEDTRLLEAALVQLGQKQWKKARAWAEERLSSPSVWVKNDRDRRHEWELVKVGALLGEAIEAHRDPLEKARTLEEAVERYAGEEHQPESGAQAVDRAHRVFEQEHNRLFTHRLPHYARLNQAVTLLRAEYRRWLDQTHGAFSELCARHGFLPPAALQQRTLYDQVVHPLLQGEQSRTAYFLVDALRYEMAVELAEMLEEEALSLHLTPRLAELPTKTSVGMNVLAPVCVDGKLTVADTSLKGFRAGEYLVTAPQSRGRAMGERSLQRLPDARRTPVWLDLRDLTHKSVEQLRKEAEKSSLVVVHTQEVDEGGEADLGLTTFAGWVGRLHSAILALRNAGVEEFVITADHGFLLTDRQAEPVSYNTAGVKRRFIFTDKMVKDDSMNTVSFESLGYQGADGYLMFRKDSRVFDTRGKSAATFVHGGNSLQERVIPVMRVSFKKTIDQVNLNQYRVIATPDAPVLGCSCMKIRLQKTNAEEGLLDYADGEKVAISLRVVDLPGEVLIKDVSNAELVHEQLLMDEKEECRVYFTIQASGANKVALEVYHPFGQKTVEPCIPKVLFPVDVKLGEKAAAPEPTISWLEQLPDWVREVFGHLDKHGVITEEELQAKVGGGTRARMFARKLDDLLKQVPFGVVIKTENKMKRWEKK